MQGVNKEIKIKQKLNDEWNCAAHAAGQAHEDEHDDRQDEAGDRPAQGVANVDVGRQGWLIAWVK